MRLLRMTGLVLYGAVQAGAVPAGTVLSGCSLVSLSSDIEQAQCASDEDCDVLNDRSAPDFDPCEIWQCADTLSCARTPLDKDHDSFTPATVMQDGQELVCETEASEVDCDDRETMSNPGLPEMCDELDNDCDTRTDEGVLEDKPSVVSAFADENAGGPGELSYAVDPDSGAIAVAYAISRGAENVVGLSTIAGGLSSGSPIRALKLPGSDLRQLLAESVGVGALGGDKFAVAFRNTSGAKVMVAGIVEPSDATLELTVDERILRFGLACGEGEACSANSGLELADATAMITNTDETSTPALAALGDELLVVYSRTPEDAACVAKDEAAAVAPVFANLLVHASSGLMPRGRHATSIGMTADAASPAVIAIPIEEDPDSEMLRRWLVAFSNDEGAVELRQVHVGEDALEVSDPLLSLSNAQERFTDVSVTLGPSDEDGHLLGVAVQRGCGVMARVVAFIVRLRTAEDGGLRADLLAHDVAVGGGASESRASIAYSERHAAFVVAYRDPSGLRARVFGRDGTLFGAGAYPLLRNVESGDNRLSLISAPFAVPLTTRTGWFGAIAATQRADDRVLQTVTLSSCL